MHRATLKYLILNNKIFSCVRYKYLFSHQPSRRKVLLHKNCSRTICMCLDCGWKHFNWIHPVHDPGNVWPYLITPNLKPVLNLDRLFTHSLGQTESGSADPWNCCLEQIHRIQDGVSWGEMYVYNTINTVYYALVVKSLEVDKKKCFPGWCLDVLHVINLSLQWDVSQQVIKAWIVTAAWIRFQWNLLDNKVNLVNQTGSRSNSVSV